jgi:ADP-heptose:LPS heptosyltransferase
MPMASEQPRRVLVVKLSALGDIVQAEGAMHDIRLHHPDAEITVMTTPPYRRLMERCPWVDCIFIDPRASRWRLDCMLTLRRRLRREAFELVYDLQQVGRTDCYYRWFLRGTPWVGGARGCSVCCRRPADRCAADHFALCLAMAGVPVQHTLRCDVSWMAEDVGDILGRAGLTGPFAVLVPGGSAEHPEKRWPYYRQLAERMRQAGWQIATVPGPGEVELCRGIGGHVLLEDDGRVLDIFRLAGILRRAALVVGNDTGPTHIAVHLQRPGLALFSNHIPPTFSGIQHGRFDWIEQADLRDLAVVTVWQRLAPLLALSSSRQTKI